MALISVTGKAKGVSREEIKKASQFFLKKLLPRSHYFIELDIEIRQDLHKKEKICGDVINIDECRYPKEFELRVDGLMGYEETIKTIAHECVHIRQYSRGQLYEYHKSMKTYRFDDKIYYNPEYDARPWEQEAEALEQTLFEEYIWQSKKKLLVFSPKAEASLPLPGNSGSLAQQFVDGLMGLLGKSPQE